MAFRHICRRPGVKAKNCTCATFVPTVLLITSELYCIVTFSWLISVRKICSMPLNKTKRNWTSLLRFFGYSKIYSCKRTYEGCSIFLKQYRLLKYLPSVLQSKVGKILLHLWRTMFQSEISSPPTNCLIRYLIRFINFPHFSKHLLYSLAGFCANLYISSFSLNTLNPFPNRFDKNGQRLTKNYV